MIGRLVKLSFLVAVAAIATGIWLGATRAALGAAPLKTVDATAQFESNRGIGIAWTEDKDQQFVFDVHRIPWASGSKVGKGDPPCLRTPGRKVEVKIGYRSIKLPDGRTSADVPLWISCR
jgi:hypothetical protein